VGLEAMAAGGITFTGCTGEDYAVPFVNSFVLETADPMEIVGYMTYLRHHPEECTRIRKAARRTARYFTWEAAVQNLIGRLENQARIRGILDGNPLLPSPQFTPPDSRLRFHRDSANSDIEQNGTRFDALSYCARDVTEVPPRISQFCNPG